MRYVMKEKLWSWGDDFTIKNEAQQDMYLVDGKVFSWGDHLSFQDMRGRELALIDQKLWSWGPTYEIKRRNQVLAIVKKKLFTFFKCEFMVDVPGPDDLKAEGDFLEHEYTFTLHGRPVAQVSKKWWSWTDTYGIDIVSGQDEVLLLCSAVVIDMVCHNTNSDD